MASCHRHVHISSYDTPSSDALQPAPMQDTHNTHITCKGDLGEHGCRHVTAADTTNKEDKTPTASIAANAKSKLKRLACVAFLEDKSHSISGHDSEEAN